MVMLCSRFRTYNASSGSYLRLRRPDAFLPIGRRRASFTFRGDVCRRDRWRRIEAGLVAQQGYRASFAVGAGSARRLAPGHRFRHDARQSRLFEMARLESLSNTFFAWR